LEVGVGATQGIVARAIWDSYAPLVRGVLRRVFEPEDAVEDAVHDVFVRLFENVSQVRDTSALRSYIVTIALNTARSELRRRRVRSIFGFSGDEPRPRRAMAWAPPASPELEARIATARLFRILDALPAEERVVILLRYVEEMELTEVAERSGVSLATVKRRLSRASERIIARAKRDAILTDYFDDDLESEAPLR
jgi:RNA polymerase sigma-70 factor (ECF subfamily)